LPNVILDNSVDIILAYRWPQLHKIGNDNYNRKNKYVKLIGNRKINSIKMLNKKFPKATLTSNKILRNKIIVNDRIDCYTSYFFNKKLISSISKKLRMGGHFIFNHSSWSIEILDYVMEKHGFMSDQSNIYKILGTSASGFHSDCPSNMTYIYDPDCEYEKGKFTEVYYNKSQNGNYTYQYYPHEYKCYVKVA
jgi:hypothetical protein